MKTSAIAQAPLGYRLPPDAHVGRVVLQVSDLDRSLEYYSSTLGLRQAGGSAATGVQPDPARWATLAPHDDERILVELRERRGAPRLPERGRLGLFHFAIVVPNRPSLGRFLRSLIDRHVPLGAADHMVSEALYLTDPDGLGIEVYRDRPRGEWIVRDGQVMGGSDPLDTAGLLDAAAGDAWQGMPPGTRMGHVHFHVGDLDRARVFYHQGLGLDHVNWRFPGAMFLSAGGYHHHVGVNTWAQGAPPAAFHEARMVEWELVLPSRSEVEAVSRSLTAAGHSPVVENAVTRVADPWGITATLTSQ